MPVHLRRKQLILTYWVNLKGQQDNHPIKGVLEACWEHGKRKVNSFGWIIKDLVREMEHGVIPTVILPMIPLWILPQPKMYLFLLEARQDTDQELLEAELTKQYIGIKYEQYVHVVENSVLLKCRNSEEKTRRLRIRSSAEFLYSMTCVVICSHRRSHLKSFLQGIL